MTSLFSSSALSRIPWLAACFFLLAFLGGSMLPVQAAPVHPKQSQSVCPGERFSDVCPGDWFYSYVMDLSGMGAISGYSDGTFHSYSLITRAQVMKVIVIANGLTAGVPGTPTFADVPTTYPLFTWVEIGAANGVVGGYICGGPGEQCDAQRRPYFRPNANVNRGQLAKMVVNAAGWSPYMPAQPTFNDVATNNPYYAYVESVNQQGVISGYDCGAPGEPCPGRYFRSLSTASRAQASKVISIELSTRRTPTPTSTWSAGGPPTRTPTRTRTPVRSATPTSVATSTTTPQVGCSVYPANNIWNRNIAALPTHALSANYMASIGLGSSVHADFGSGQWEGAPIGIPYVNVPGNQPRVPITFT